MFCVFSFRTHSLLLHCFFLLPLLAVVCFFPLKFKASWNILLMNCCCYCLFFILLFSFSFLFSFSASFFLHHYFDFVASNIFPSLLWVFLLKFVYTVISFNTNFFEGDEKKAFYQHLGTQLVTWALGPSPTDSDGFFDISSKYNKTI